jgi:hypothetical protein
MLANFTQSIGALITSRILLHLRQYAREEEKFGAGGRGFGLMKRGRKGPDGKTREIEGWGELSVGWETWDVEARTRGFNGGKIAGGPVSRGGMRRRRDGELTTLEFRGGEAVEMSLSFGTSSGSGSRGDTTTTEPDTGDEWSRTHHGLPHDRDQRGHLLDVNAKGKARQLSLSSSDHHSNGELEKPKGLSVEGGQNASSPSDAGADAGVTGAHLKDTSSGLDNSEGAQNSRS